MLFLLSVGKFVSISSFLKTIFSFLHWLIFLYHFLSFSLCNFFCHFLFTWYLGAVWFVGDIVWYLTEAAPCQADQVLWWCVWTAWIISCCQSYLWAVESFGCIRKSLLVLILAWIISCCQSYLWAVESFGCIRKSLLVLIHLSYLLTRCCCLPWFWWVMISLNCRCESSVGCIDGSESRSQVWPGIHYSITDSKPHFRDWFWSHGAWWREAWTEHCRSSRKHYFALQSYLTLHFDAFFWLIYFTDRM